MSQLTVGGQLPSSRTIIDADALPTDRRGVERWLDRRAALAARKTRLALRKIIGDALDGILDSLTASVDLTPLDSIVDAWLTVVSEELLPDLGATYMAGSVTAWLGMPKLSTLTQQTTNRAIDFAAQWSNVVNDNAVSYMAKASNRLAGVGQTTWRQVRSQVSNAIEKGLSTEDLKEQIESTRQWSEFRADTIARTETNAAYVQGDMAGGRALGNDGPVEKVWVAVLDNRTRESHADASDQCVPFDESFEVGGVSMDSPLDPSAPPEEVVNCRCYVELLYEGDTRPDGSTVEGDPSRPPAQLTIDDDEPTDE